MLFRSNGAVIPTSIVNKIITRVEEICPVYQLSTKYNVGGTLTIPYYDESTQSITMAYATEFNELESTAGEFKSISLTGYLAGVLSLISKSLINNSQFDIVSVVIERMAVSVSRWIEKELLFGTKDKMEGLSEIWRQGLSARDTQPPALRTGSLTRPYLKKRRQTGKRKPMQPRSRRGKPRKQ